MRTCSRGWQLLAVVTLVLAIALPGATAWGEPAPPGLTGGPLADVNASLTGEGAGDRVGDSAVIAGDVNGDGYGDLLIGADGWPDGGWQGRAYLFLGGPAGWGLQQGVAAADAIYTGEAGSRAGASLAGAGDVNDDGYDDMLIGAWMYNGGQGRAYLVLGSDRPTSIGNLGTGADAVYTGEAVNDYAGTAVAGAGDLNGDGHADLLITATGASGGAGQAYLVLGSDHPTSIANLRTGADVVYTGEAGTYAGTSAAGAGDVDGDGYADVLIGASGAAGGKGRAYLVSGTGHPANLNLGFVTRFTGETAGDQAGADVAAAGDVNGDGYDDFLIGADRYNDLQGRAYLVLGQALPNSIDNLGTEADAIYTGHYPWDYAGSAVAGAGDVNADGFGDLLIGADGWPNGGWEGRAYLVLGSANPASIANLDAGADVIYTGEASSGAGRTVAGGDVNGDGYADLLVGASGVSGQRGRVYLIFSDYTGATAARYRARLAPANVASRAVGPTGVTVDYSAGALGSVYVTRHYVSTCNQEIDSNGLLWTVDSQRAGSAVATLTFKYNKYQIAGWDESQLKLYYRTRPCQDWTQDTGAVLDAAHNRITSSAVTDPHREYTLAPSQPSPTLVQVCESDVQPVAPGKQDIALLAVLALAAGAVAWERHRRRAA